MRHPTPVAFHGVTIRSLDPAALGRRLRKILGWPARRRSAREIVLGEGPELFVRIVGAKPGEPEGIAELHLAVEGLGRSRRKAVEDPLGGDSRMEKAMEGLALTLREFKRAPSPRWRRGRG